MMRRPRSENEQSGKTGRSFSQRFGNNNGVPAVRVLPREIVGQVISYLSLSAGNVLAFRAVGSLWHSVAASHLPWHTFVPLQPGDVINVVTPTGGVPRITVDLRSELATALSFVRDGAAVGRLLAAKTQETTVLTPTLFREEDLPLRFQDPPLHGTNVVVKQCVGYVERRLLRQGLCHDLCLSPADLRMLEGSLRIDGACVAGGFVLSAALNRLSQLHRSADVDIFVPLTIGMILKDTYVYKFFEGSGWIITSERASRYLAITRCTASRQGCRNVDIVGIEGRAEDYVSRFDLTCCRIWFDGRNMGATHWHYTVRGVAFVSPVEKENKSERIAKYMARFGSIGLAIAPEELIL